MFAPTQWSGRKAWNRALLISFALHCAVVVLLVHRAAPMFVALSDVDLGVRGSSGSLSIVYLAPVGAERFDSSAEQPKPALRASLASKPQPPKAQRQNPEPNPMPVNNAPDQTARGGSPYGRVPGAPITGDEVMPALPEVFPDPPVYRSDLPAGVEGDVIVEVTIDAQGNVVETKLLQGIGYGVEEKVLAVLQRWHFRPASRDGVTIASQHIVHFHYPS